MPNWVNWALGAIVVVVGAVAAVAADEIPMRSFDRFPFDTATAKGIWAELGVGGAHFEDERNVFGRESSLETDTVTVQPTIAYGGDSWEVGLLVPYRYVDAKACLLSPGLTMCEDDQEDGIGDMNLYGKYIFRSEYVHAGAGLDLSLPSGDEDKGLGAGELGIAPFGTAAAVVGPAEVRAHVGNLFFTGSDSWGYYSRRPSDVLLYGVGLFYAIGDRVGVRGELVGSRIDRDEDQDVLAFEPGVDVRIPLGAVDLMIRPTAAVGLTDASADWGAGVAIGIHTVP